MASPQDPSIPWAEMARIACVDTLDHQTCPVCQSGSLHAAWHLTDVGRRQASVQLLCANCDASQEVEITLPDQSLPCWPPDRITQMFDAIEQERQAMAAKIRQHVQSMPAAQFATHPLWAQANWCATTYHWHPTSSAPPLMGIVFENTEAGLQIFRDAKREMNHEDRFEEIRISIIEGEIEWQSHRPGYSIHLCADPDALAGHATMADFVVDPQVLPFLGQWNRHYPIPGTPSLLDRFKQEFSRHQEFMLAPTMVRSDGQRYMVHELGIIKSAIQFRKLEDIAEPNDIDFAAHLMPQLIVLPTEDAMTAKP
jgi:transcription elongation factor Elf1